ncbi:MAG: EpsG family protein [Rikenellaceae bacterium]|nr:EpsG family protein [Rikenellaceae bacterium]
MAVYIIIFILIAWSAIAVKDTGKKKVVLILEAFILCVLASARGEIDADILQYNTVYDNIISQYTTGSFEFSFMVISKISYYLFHSFQGVLFIYAALSLIPLTYIIIKYWKADLWVLLLYYSFFFFLHTMTQIRLSAAIVYLLLSVRFIIEKKPLRFLLCILIGGCFHQTILLFAPFYFILRRSLSVRVQAIGVLIAVILSLTTHLSTLLFTLVSELSGNAMISKLMMHKATLDGGVGARTASYYYIMALLKIIFNLFLQYHLKNKDRLLSAYLQIHYYGYLIYLLFSDIHLVAARITELLGITEIFFIPYLIQVIKPKYIGESLVLLIAAGQLIVTLYLVGFIQPYKTFLF